MKDDFKEASIIFELVLIGFQVIIWAFLLMVAIFGYQWIKLDALQQWSTQLSVALVGVAYMFGIMFDKAVSSLPYRWIVGGGRLMKIGDRPHPLLMRMDILAAKPEIFDVLEKRLNQHRLVRASVFNLALISLAALVFLIAQIGFDLRLLIVFVALSAITVRIALFTGTRSAETLYFELFHIYNTINGGEDTNDQDEIGVREGKGDPDMPRGPQETLP